MSELSKLISAAAKETDTKPSLPQIEAGNYRKGRFSWNGMVIAIENPKGSKRRPEWPALSAHYGYITRTESDADGDPVDVFIGPNPKSDVVFVVDQCKQSGRFDEHKCMIGWDNEADAKAAYLASYTPGWKCGPITAMTVTQFRNWLEKGDTGRRVETQVSLYMRRQYAATPAIPKPPGMGAASEAQHQVGETKPGKGGGTLVFSQNHHWTKQGQDEPAGDQPGPQQPEVDPAVQSRHDAAVEGLKSVHQQVGGIIRALHEHPDYKATGTVHESDVNPRQAGGMYEWMRQNVGKSAGGGRIVDLGGGRLGFTSKAGAITAAPPKPGSKKWDVRYTNDTALVGKSVKQPGQNPATTGQPETAKAAETPAQDEKPDTTGQNEPAARQVEPTAEPTAKPTQEWPKEEEVLPASEQTKSPSSARIKKAHDAALAQVRTHQQHVWNLTKARNDAKIAGDHGKARELTNRLAVAKAHHGNAKIEASKALDAYKQATAAEKAAAKAKPKQPIAAGDNSVPPEQTSPVTSPATSPVENEPAARQVEGQPHTQTRKQFTEAGGNAHSHKAHVLTALQRGEQVSPEVLADYPELAKRKPTAPARTESPARELVEGKRTLPRMQPEQATADDLMKAHPHAARGMAEELEKLDADGVRSFAKQMGIKVPKGMKTHGELAAHVLGDIYKGAKAPIVPDWKHPTVIGGALAKAGVPDTEGTRRAVESAISAGEIDGPAELNRLLKSTATKHNNGHRETLLRRLRKGKDGMTEDQYNARREAIEADPHGAILHDVIGNNSRRKADAGIPENVQINTTAKEMGVHPDLLHDKIDELHELALDQAKQREAAKKELARNFGSAGKLNSKEDTANGDSASTSGLDTLWEEWKNSPDYAQFAGGSPEDLYELAKEGPKPLPKRGDFAKEAANLLRKELGLDRQQREVGDEEDDDFSYKQEGGETPF